VATTRDELHALLDAVPDDRLNNARAALEALSDPFLVALLNVPEDDEPVTEDDLEALAEARAEYARGETIPLDVIRCEFGW
jgi:hypothetical protein